jgi:hypothetical protein
MTVNYTTNLALGQPVTGTESGTWGDDVNNAVTSYLDIAIAGGLSVTVTTADVTLTLTQGTSSATNIGSTTAQYAILNVSGAMTAARNLILPSSSRQYVINNACTGGFLLTVKGSATTGVTLVNGEKAHVFWNGSDYAKLSNTPGGAGTFSSITNTGLTATRVVYSTTGGLETDSANLTFDGTNLTLLGGTANGVAFLNGSKVLTTGSALTFDGIGTLAVNATGNGVLNIFGSSTNNAIFRLQNSTTGNLAGFFANNSKQLVFEADGTTEQMRLTSTGLGIGTSSPAAKLDVKGGSTISTLAGWNTLSNSMFELANPAVRFGIGYDSSDQVLLQAFDSSNGARSLSLQAYGGNVGIGTSSPTDKLQVEGNIYLGTNSRTIYQGSSADLTLQVNTGNIKFFRANGVSESMRIDSSGNLLVGTTASAGDITNTAPVVAGVFKTLSGTVSAATATATTIATLPSLNNGTYIVSCGLTAADPNNYSAVSLVTVDGVVLRITNLQTAALMSITISGQTVRATQISGTTQTVFFTLTRVS